MHQRIFASILPAIRTIRRVSAGSLKTDLTFQQFRVLSQVKEGMSQTQIAQNLQVSGAAVSKIVDVLVKKKLLIRSTGTDRRCSHLRLSANGEKVWKNVRGEVGKIIDRNYKKLTASEQADLNRGLDVLDKLMGLLNEEE